VLGTLLAAGSALGVTGCEGSSRAPDAQARANAESAEVSVRFDISPAKETIVEVLAFRATVSALQDLVRPDVLGTVDPLAAAGPSQGCMARDVDVANRVLSARGASIELQELTGIGIGLGDGATLLRPSPQLYPDVAAGVGGIVAQVGPQPVAALPDRVSLFTADTELPVAELAVPGAPHVTSIDGAPPTPALRVDAQEPLAVTVSGGAGGVLELRPYGATAAIACAIPSVGSADVTIVIPRALLAYLIAGSSRGGAGAGVAASLEVARRARVLQSTGSGTRISVEVRATTTVELRP
jgi:hypothetical protein